MAVDDHGLEVLKKSGEKVTPGDNSNYYLKVGLLTGSAGPLAGVVWDYLDVQQTSSTVETYVFKNGGSGGTIVKTIVVTYTSSDKTDLHMVQVS